MYDLTRTRAPSVGRFENGKGRGRSFILPSQVHSDSYAYCFISLNSFSYKIDLFK